MFKETSGAPPDVIVVVTPVLAGKGNADMLMYRRLGAEVGRREETGMPGGQLFKDGG